MNSGKEGVGGHCFRLYMRCLPDPPKWPKEISPPAIFCYLGNDIMVSDDVMLCIISTTAINIEAFLS